MKNDLRFCIVGRGSIGTRHLKNLKHLSCDNIIAYSENSDKNKDNLYREKYNVKTVYDLNELELLRPDAFIIANPTARHLEMAKIAVDMKSHILMEKPLSNNLKDAYNLNDDLSKKNLVFLLGNNLRFHPALIAIKRLVTNNEFGEIYFARIMVGQYLPDWHLYEDYRNSYSAIKKLGGGVVLTLQHEIDYAYWLFGKFKGVKSYVRKISDLQIDVEDIASIIIETKSCKLIEIHLDYLQRPAKRSIQIQGSKGSVDYRFGDSDLGFYDFDKQEYNNILDLSNYDTNKMYLDELEYFIDSINNRNMNMNNIDDAIYVLKACLEIKKEYI